MKDGAESKGASESSRASLSMTVDVRHPRTKSKRKPQRVHTRGYNPPPRTFSTWGSPVYESIKEFQSTSLVTPQEPPGYPPNAGHEPDASARIRHCTA